MVVPVIWLYWSGSPGVHLVGKDGTEYPIWRPGLTWEADFDEDEDVDVDDLALWRNFVGMTTTAAHVHGDADHDRDVDGDDFLTWQRQLGRVGVPPIAGLPEPGSWQLAAAGIALAATRVRLSDLVTRAKRVCL